MFIPVRMGFIYPPHVQTRVIIFMCWVFVDTLTCVVHMTRALCFRCSSPSTSQPYCITTSAPAGQTLASSRQPRRRRRRYDSGCDWLAWYTSTVTCGEILILDGFWNHVHYKPGFVQLVSEQWLCVVNAAPCDITHVMDITADYRTGFTDKMRIKYHMQHIVQP